MHIRGSRRAYWVTGDPQSMDSYEKGTSFIPNRLIYLKEFVRESAAQVQNVAVLDSMVTSLMRYWRTDGIIQPNMPIDAFRNIVVGEEKRLEVIYEQLEKIKIEEEELLVTREAVVAGYNERNQAYFIHRY